jgi:hypothetical protein
MSDGERKTLTVDPNLFSISNNTSRKNRKREDSGKIKVKSEPKKKQDTIKKKSILKMIRAHQEERYKKLLDKGNATVNADPSTIDFNKEFQEAKQFMETLSAKNELKNKMKNYTLKQTANVISPQHFPEISSLQAIEPTMQTIPISPIQLASPKYGCLKNGTLPTYRSFMNSTQKQYPTPILIGGGSANPRVEEIETKIANSMKRVSEMTQTSDKMKQFKPFQKPKKQKQKRTLRRTYKIGKSKVLPKVSVLVSNKTLRNNISTKSQLLKQVPIQDVKKYLIKRGFIKVGSIAPNDVLRKMYESAILICGEVQNHNPDNLLYNFLNSGDV